VFTVFDIASETTMYEYDINLVINTELYCYNRGTCLV